MVASWYNAVDLVDILVHSALSAHPPSWRYMKPPLGIEISVHQNGASCIGESDTWAVLKSCRWRIYMQLTLEPDFVAGVMPGSPHTYSYLLAFITGRYLSLLPANLCFETLTASGLYLIDREKNAKRGRW
jgi:hypothetical protein